VSNRADKKIMTDIENIVRGTLPGGIVCLNLLQMEYLNERGLSIQDIMTRIHASDLNDMVNHPPHYNFSSLEVIDVLEAWNLGYHEACVVKYVVRAKHKGKELEDLEKALWYLKRRIDQITREQDTEAWKGIIRDQKPSSP